MDLIAEAVGFGSPASFRQNFANAFAISPSGYRRQFSAVSKRAATPGDEPASAAKPAMAAA